MTRLSVVIPTYNRLEQLKRVLAALEAQTVPLGDFEVIVVSDGSVDGTEAFLQAANFGYALCPICQQNEGVAVARNQGIAAACGEIILFIDDDVVPRPELIAEHLNSHEGHGVETVVLGPMLAPPDFALSPWVEWEQAMLVKQYEAMVHGVYEPTARQFYTGNSSLRREFLLQAGGFDPAFRRAEDIELAFRLDRLGLRFVFNPRAIGYHYAERTFQAWLAIPYSYGRNDVVFTREREQSWLLPTVFREYHNRHLMVRLLTRLCLDRPGPSRLVLRLLEGAARGFHRRGLRGLSRMACSGLWNLCQYQGVSDQLGGRHHFFDGTDTARPAEQGVYG